MDVTKQIKKFQEFFEENYHADLLERIRKGDNFIYIDFRKISKFSPVLAELILDQPEDLIVAAQLAIEQFDITKKVNNFKVRFKNLPSSQEIMVTDKYPIEYFSSPSKEVKYVSAGGPYEPSFLVFEKKLTLGAGSTETIHYEMAVLGDPEHVSGATFPTTAPLWGGKITFLDTGYEKSYGFDKIYISNELIKDESIISGTNGETKETTEPKNNTKLVLLALVSLIVLVLLIFFFLRFRKKQVQKMKKMGY